MADLTTEEQQRVRATLHYLRRKIGGWRPLAKALRYTEDSLERVASGRSNNVTPRLAFRVARFANIGIDDLLTGRYRPGACPRCGYLPDSEEDPTVWDDLKY